VFERGAGKDEGLLRRISGMGYVDFAKEETNPKEGILSAPFRYRAFAWVLIACNAVQGRPDLKPFAFVVVPPYLELRPG
jgi:hypothetical protein